MEKQANLLQSLRWVALGTAALLMVPAIAMQFSSDVQWDLLDFAIMGTLIFSAGFGYVLLARYAPNFIFRAAIAAAVGSTFLLVWANLAVGLIGSGSHIGNWMYVAVVVVFIVGCVLSRFSARGMELTSFAAALSVVILAVIALAANMQNYPGSSVAEILAVNAFFAMLYSVAGLLFRFVALDSSSKASR